MYKHTYIGFSPPIRFPSFISVIAAVGPPTYSARGVGELMRGPGEVMRDVGELGVSE